MPQIIPIKDLKNTSEISEMCHKSDEPIYITKNGKVVAKLTNPHQNRAETAKALFGILPKDADIDAARDERLDNK